MRHDLTNNQFLARFNHVRVIFLTIQVARFYPSRCGFQISFIETVALVEGISIYFSYFKKEEN